MVMHGINQGHVCMSMHGEPGQKSTEQSIINFALMTDYMVIYSYTITVIKRSSPMFT